MARNRGKKALYEVMSTARSKSALGRTPERAAAERSVENEPPFRAGSQPPASKGAAKWWKKPRIVQLNGGRIEFSVPYQIAVAATLVLVFMLLASYRLGQFSGPDEPQAPPGGQPRTQTPEPQSRAAADMTPPAAPAQRTPEPERVQPAAPAGDNVIVLAHYHTMADLQPVLAHFAAHNIETEIVPVDGQYRLQTKQRYVSTTTPGSDGYKAIQRIKEVGALYKGKAPPGYEPFAPHYFSDAYGHNVKK